jgi:hypothetical protein
MLMTSTIRHTYALAFALALASCGDSNVRDAVCGDLTCDSSESAASCAEDCGCGNGVLNAGEECDGTDLGGASCASTGNGTGTLGCNTDCTFKTDRCDNSNCGNGIVEEGEECDGTDLAGSTCDSVGFAAGQLACNTNCRLDVGACCNNFCDAASSAACAGDTIQTCTQQANGCLALDVTDCAAQGLSCDDSSDTPACACVNRCNTEGQGRCFAAVAQTCTEQANGCLDWTTTVDCADTGRTCAIGPNGATCAAAASGEDCFDVYSLAPGENLVAWTASTADYLLEQPSCGVGTLTGPDLVLSYTATVDGVTTYTIEKQAAMRQTAVVTRAACGTVTKQAEVSCVNDTENTSMSDAFSVTAGTTYYIYVRDTSTGAAPLPNPLLITIQEGACAGATNATSSFSPANGTSVYTPSPIVSFSLSNPIRPGTGVITLTGDQGTVFTYDLATTQPAVTITENGRRVSIDPGVFKPNEVVTVSWTGLVDEICGLAIPAPTWTFALGAPSCSPGVGGMVGTTVTRLATGLSSLTEYYVTVDQEANGYVYFGGLTELFRMPKAGGTVENVVTAAVIGSTQLGYALTTIGAKVFALDSLATTTSPFLWRLTTSGGVSWNPLGYAKYSITPGASAKSMFHHNGRLYWVTDETTAAAATEIWSISASAVQLPAVPTLEASLGNLNDCDSIAGDDNYFYLACDDDNDHIVRVDRTTKQVELITSSLPLNLTKNELIAQDLDVDGRADVLYVKSDDEAVRYICGPGYAGPFWHDILVEWGPATTGNYGMSFDPVAKALWAFDDDTRELVIIR